MKVSTHSILFFLLLTGCNAMSTADKTEHADHHGDPVYRKNPHPTQAYRISMTIEDAPGPFAYVSGAAFYDMTNRDACAPVDPLLGMSTKMKEDSIPINFQRVNETTYVATIHADGMADADYYGKGVCKFELGSLGVTLSATGSDGETRFQPTLLKHEILGAGTVTTYFWKGGYPRDVMANYQDSGHRNPDEFKADLRHQLFKVVLTSREESP